MEISLCTRPTEAVFLFGVYNCTMNNVLLSDEMQKVQYNWTPKTFFFMRAHLFSLSLNYGFIKVHE